MPQKAKATKEITKEFDYKTIKTFKDACKKVQVDPATLPDTSMVLEEFKKAIINCYKLFIIYKAINNGWTPEWSDFSQYKYYPWFKVLSSGSGFDFSVSFYDFGITDASVGSRLCTDSSEKALYIGKQFGEEFIEFFLIKK